MEFVRKVRGNPVVHRSCHPELDTMARRHGVPAQQRYSLSMGTLPVRPEKVGARMRLTVAAMAAGLLGAGTLLAPHAAAEPPDCDNPSCTPGIAPGIVLGSYCDNPTYYAFGVTSWGRLVFCGSPRRYEPRWFRTTSMWGVKQEGGDCAAYQPGDMAQAPDGLFLTCVAKDGRTFWERGDL